MKYKLTFVIGLILLCTSCKNKTQNSSEKNKIADDETVVNFNEVISDYNTWWSYHYYNINLSSDFIPVNTNSEIIDKDMFLKDLTSGNYIPLELKSNDSIPKYKLFKLPEDVLKSIVGTIKSTSEVTYKYFKMEGMKFPEFNFVDIDGNEHNNDQFKNKITVLKTWFIACVPCIQEFPELNRLVDKYSDNKKIQFVSLATDDKKPLEKFLKEKEFKYAVVPEQREFIQETLNLNIYPTHIIVDQKGVIKKVVNKAPHMISYLENNTDLPDSQTEKNLSPPPPPPPPPPVKK